MCSLAGNTDYLDIDSKLCGICHLPIDGSHQSYCKRCLNSYNRQRYAVNPLPKRYLDEDKYFAIQKQYTKDRYKIFKKLSIADRKKLGLTCVKCDCVLDGANMTYCKVCFAEYHRKYRAKLKKRKKNVNKS